MNFKNVGRVENPVKKSVHIKLRNECRLKILIRQIFLMNSRFFMVNIDRSSGGEFSSRKGIFDDRVSSPGMFIRSGAFAAHADRGGQGQGLEYRVVDVAAHVPESAGAEIEPFAPVSGVVPVVPDEGPFRADTQP